MQNAVNISFRSKASSTNFAFFIIFLFLSQALWHNESHATIFIVHV